eukprot:5338617-Pyramimonas_sp.AAC.1
MFYYLNSPHLLGGVRVRRRLPRGPRGRRIARGVHIDGGGAALLRPQLRQRRLRRAGPRCGRYGGASP